MKNKIGIFVIVMVALMAFSSCDPIEKRLEMKGAVTMADVDKLVTVTQEVRNGKKSNFFKFDTGGLKALTTFQHSLGVVTGSTGDYIQCFLFPGSVEVVLTVLNSDGTALPPKKFNFTIDEAFDVAPQWDMLTASSSKTWVFAGEPGDGKVWYAMAAPEAMDDGPTGLMSDPIEGIWWNAGADCCPPADLTGRMVFEANGLVVTTYASPTAAAKKGTFLFSPDFKEITFKGTNALGSFESDKGGNTHGVYKIVNLSNNDLFLFTSSSAAGTGWVWRFKPQ